MPGASKPVREERPDHPFTGFKLAYAVRSADGARTAFTGLSLGASQVYGVCAEASCVWNRRHLTPRRRCGCGFYCLHELSDAQSLGCATANRSALLLEVTASGRYIRYERGLRYSRQRVRAIRDSWCGCGRPGAALIDAGSGLVGWRHLAPVCEQCATERPGRPVLRMTEFAALLDSAIRVESALAEAPSATAPAATVAANSPVEESAIAVLTAEVALLHARLDDLQSRLDR